LYNLSTNNTDLLGCYWLLRSFVKLLDGLLIVSQILLATDENDWKTVAKVEDF